jgi:hypothetical protein
VSALGLFGHLISLRNQSWQIVRPSAFSGIEIDHEPKFDWPFNRQIGRVGALENVIYEIRLASVQVRASLFWGAFWNS